MIDIVATYLGYGVLLIAGISAFVAALFGCIWALMSTVQFMRGYVSRSPYGEPLYTELGEKVGTYWWYIGPFYIKAYYYRKAKS